MVRRKEPTAEYGYLIIFYKCPYCKKSFDNYEIDNHIETCFISHRQRVKEACRERAVRNFKEGKILKNISRKKS